MPFTRSVIPPSLIAAGSIIYAHSSGIYALDAATGALLRHHPLRSLSSFSVHDDLLFFGMRLEGGQIGAVRSEDGAEVWRFATDGRPTEAPVLADGVAYAATIEGDVFALDAASDALRWRCHVGPIMFSFPTIDGDMVYASPAVNAPDTPVIVALDAQTGHERWRVALPDSTTQHIVFKGGSVFVATHSSCLALDPRDGTLLWQQPLPGMPSSPALPAGEALYLTTTEMRSEWADATSALRSINIPSVTALHAATGAPLWRRALGDGLLPPTYLTTPAVTATAVYVGADDGALHALSADDGHDLWRYPTGGDRLFAPIVLGDVVYASANDGNVYALDATTGALRWRTFTNTSTYAAVGMTISAITIGPVELPAG